MNRVVSRRLIPKVDRDLREGIWHLSTLYPHHRRRVFAIGADDDRDGFENPSCRLGLLDDLLAPRRCKVRRARVTPRSACQCIVAGSLMAEGLVDSSMYLL